MKQKQHTQNNTEAMPEEKGNGQETSKTTYVKPNRDGLIECMAIQAGQEVDTSKGNCYMGYINGWQHGFKKCESILKADNQKQADTIKELLEAFEKRGTLLREYQSTLKMLVEAARGSSITNWPQLKIAKELLNK